jgi:hypothetical protein
VSEANEASDKPRPIVFAVRDLPIELFGGKHGRSTRKLMLLTIATHANSDGTNCYPGVESLAQECGLGRLLRRVGRPDKWDRRGAQKVIKWLRGAGLLTVNEKASPLHTNLYIVNASGHDALQRARCPEASSTVNASGHGDGELQRAPNLPVPTSLKPTKLCAPSANASGARLSRSKTSSKKTKTPDEIGDTAKRICQVTGTDTKAVRAAVRSVLTTEAKHGVGPLVMEGALVQAHGHYSGTIVAMRMGPERFFGEGEWRRWVYGEPKSCSRETLLGPLALAAQQREYWSGLTQ